MKNYSKNSLAFKSAMRAIGNLNNLIETGKNTGSGNYSSSTEWTADTLEIIKAFGYNCKSMNIAPRGGKSGERVIAYEKN